jgi:hypothetical protein
MWNRRYRWIRRLTAGLAFAALVVPTAQARIAEETGVVPWSTSDTASSYRGNGVELPNGTRLPVIEYNGYGYQHGTGVPVAEQAPASAVRPDDRATRVVGQPSGASIAVRPDDRAARFSPAAGDVQQAPSLVGQPSGSFNWSDAGIGAGMAVALMLLVLGASLLTRHTGRKALAGT